MAWAALQAVVGLLIGSLLGARLGVGPAIGAAAQTLLGIYELVAPLLVFAIVGPSLLKLLRYRQGELRRFSLYSVAWFSSLRLGVCIVAATIVVVVYRLPLSWDAGAGSERSTGMTWRYARTIGENEYLATFILACLCSWLLRNRSGKLVDWFLRIPDTIESAGNLFTRFTGLFGFLVGVYIASLPDILESAINHIHGVALHPLNFGQFQIDTASPSGLMAVYLTVTSLTAVLCMSLHTLLVVWARLRVPGFRIGGYLSGYLLRVYPLIWSTGAESLAIPANFATLRRYGRGIPDAFRDLTVGLAATLNLNGSLICCLVLIPAVCMVIGYPLTLPAFITCLPLVFVLGYAIPGIPGELVVFAAPIAQALGISGGERELFLLLFLSWQVGLTDAFRSAGSATDGVPATLLVNNAYQRRYATATMTVPYATESMAMLCQGVEQDRNGD
jgi:Na+/H+-dicarboxylate symporter